MSDSFTFDLGEYVDTEPFLHLSKEEKQKVNQEAVDSIPGLCYFENFLTEQEEKELWDKLIKFELPRTIARRSRISNTGPFSQFLIDRLKQVAGIEHERCYVNLYREGDNIGAHFDSFVTIGERVTVVSLGSTSVVQMTDLRNLEKHHVVVDPRSMYSMTGPARYEFFHALPRRVTELRMSIVFTSSTCYGSWTTLDSERLITREDLAEVARLCQEVLKLDIKSLTETCDLGTSNIMPHFPEFYNLRYMKFAQPDDFVRSVLALQPIRALIHDTYKGDFEKVDKDEFARLWEKEILSDPTLYYKNQLPPPIPDLNWSAMKIGRQKAVNY